MEKIGVEEINRIVFNYVELKSRIEGIIILYKGACSCVTTFSIIYDNIWAEYEIYVGGESYYEEIEFPVEWLEITDSEELKEVIKRKKEEDLNRLIAGLDK